MAQPSSNPKDFTYEVTYYSGYGLAEQARLIIRAGGLPLTNVFIDDDTLAPLKPSLLFGQVPRLRVKDKAGNVVLEIVQSRAIVRYLSTITRICGDTPEETALIDQFYEGIKDSNEVASRNWWKPERVALMADVAKADGPLHAQCKKYDTFLQKNGTGYLVLNKLTVADLLLFIFTEEAKILLKDVSAYSNLVAHHEKIASIPSVKDYINDPSRVKSFYAQPELF